ncbi:MAG: ANTAR domain-containing response regulator [Gaiellaceae bacterium]
MTEALPLRILIANERLDRLELLAQVVAGLGHEVVGRETNVPAVGALTARVRPDVAIVGLGASSQHALDLVSAIVREAFCPVIAVLAEHDPEWVAEAAKRGVYAHLLDDHPAELQSALDITLRRFAEYHEMQGAFERRAEEAARDEQFAHDKKRQALELHDEIVQGLAVAHLALRLGREEESQAALNETLQRARAIVTRELAELQSKGNALEQLIADTSPAAKP